MDSLTQAVLGAACGEAVLGRKIGNKALVWGAIAGTIPDLDVVTQVFLSHEADELVYHRGLTHSILFTVFGAMLFGWMGRYKRPWLLTLFYGAIFVFVAGLTIKSPSIAGAIISVLFAVMGFFFIKKWFSPNRLQLKEEPTVKEWTVMFFFAILTHWLIDACTSYGTQIFEPFSNYRISFNNIAIVDPLYTLPLLFAVIILIYVKNARSRAIINWTGIGLSTLYMAFTFYSKSLANSAFSESLKKQNIEYVDYISYPTMFNSLLWQITVRSKDAYYYGVYSIMDKDKNIEFYKLPKNHELLAPYKDEHYVKILKWFAQDYYNVTDQGNGVLQINNLRFGFMGFGMMDLEDPYIFRYRIAEKAGKFECWPIFPELEEIEFSKMFAALWRRMLGEKLKIKQANPKLEKQK
jgi:inner membrane protein